MIVLKPANKHMYVVLWSGEGDVVLNSILSNSKATKNSVPVQQLQKNDM